MATIIIVVATALGLVSLTAGGASADHRPNGPKPTIVLVHGGWADSSGWNAQVADLQNAALHPVIAPANPLRGLESDSAYIRSILTTIEGPIVLVGHSYGGAVISNAAVDVPNVKALVYIAAFAPDAGESLVQLVTMNPGTGIGPDTLIPRPYPLPGGGQGTDLYLTQDGFRNAFAADVPRKIADQMQAEQRPFFARSVRIAVRRAGLEDDPVVVPHRHQGQGDPATDTAIHGRTSRGHHRGSPSLARPDDLEARLSHPTDPGSRQRNRLTPPPAAQAASR